MNLLVHGPVLTSLLIDHHDPNNPATTAVKRRCAYLYDCKPEMTLIYSVWTFAYIDHKKFYPSALLNNKIFWLDISIKVLALNQAFFRSTSDIFRHNWQRLK